MTREQQLQDEVSFLVDLLNDDQIEAFKEYDKKQEPCSFRSETELAKLLESELNRYGFDYKEFNKEIPRMHRTVQQLLTRFCLNVILAMADQPYDARNQQAVIISQRIKEYLTSTNQTPNLPLI